MIRPDRLVRQTGHPQCLRDQVLGLDIAEVSTSKAKVKGVGARRIRPKHISHVHALLHATATQSQSLF